LYGFDQDQTEKERRTWYDHNVLTDVQLRQRSAAVQLGALFQKRYHDGQEQIRTGKLELSRRRVRADWLAQAACRRRPVQLAGLARPADGSRRVTIGGLMIYYVAFQNGLNFMQSILLAPAGLYEDSLFLTNLFRFLT